MGADKEVLPHSCKIEGVNKIKRPEEEELVVERRRRASGQQHLACPPGWSPIQRSRLAGQLQHHH